MISWMIRHFIKDWENTSNSKVRERYGVLAGAVGIASNGFLFLIKFLTGLLLGSISIMADAVNNLSDAGSSVITLIGFKISGKPADNEHPYGHARMEYICGLIVSFIIVFLGLQLIGSSFNKILHPAEVEVNAVMLFVLVVSIGVKLWQGIFNRTLGKKIDSAALQATAADSLNDVYATSAVLISALLMKFTGLRLDGWMGLAVAIFITVSGFKLVMETVNPLLGMAPDQGMVQAIQNKIMSYDGVIGIHDLVIHNYGPERCFASVHAEVPAKQDILISHDIIDNIERDFCENMNIHLVIHLDPVVNDNEEINQLREMVLEIVKGISREISMHDFRVVFGTTHTNLVFDVAVPPEFQFSDQDLCKEITKQVKQHDQTLFTVITVDRNYTYTISSDDKNM